MLDAEISPETVRLDAVKLTAVIFDEMILFALWFEHVSWKGICIFDTVILQALKAFLTLIFDALTFDVVIVVIVALLEVFENVTTLLNVPSWVYKFDVYETLEILDADVDCVVMRESLQNVPI